MIGKRLSRPARVGSGRLPLGALVRVVAIVALGTALLVAVTGPGTAQSGVAEPAAPTLRGDVVVSGDAIRFGDLVDGASPEAAATPVFHAPALGAIGTIQVARILMTAHALGVAGVETAGREQVTVTRAARRIAQDDVAAALAARIAEAEAVLPGEIEIVFDGAPPTLLTSPDVLEPVAVADLAYDATSRRFTATAFVGPSAAERRTQAAVSGTARHVVEIAVLTRAVARGDAIAEGDYRIERRAAELVTVDARLDALELDERVARRTLAAGTTLRPGDLERPVLVGRNEAVLMIYEQGALTLTLRGRARQDGSLGDLVDIENPVSERIVQAEVIGPGRVRVGPALSAGRMAALDR